MEQFAAGIAGLEMHKRSSAEIPLVISAAIPFDMRQQETNGMTTLDSNRNGSVALTPPLPPERWGAEELAATLDLVSTGIWAMDLEGQCVFANQAACRIFGYSREECLGRRLPCILNRNNPARNCPQEKCPIQQALESGAAAELDTEVFLHRDGTRLPVQCSLQPVFVRGRRTGAVITVVDVTARKLTGEALRQSNEWLRLSESLDSLGRFDPDLKTCDARRSKVQARLYGVDPDSVHPDGVDPAARRTSQGDWRTLIHPDDRDRMKRGIETAKSGTQVPATEFPIIWPDESIHWLFGTRKVILDGAGRPARLVGADADITGRVQAETALNQFFTSSPTALAICGLNGCVQQANSAWERIHGFSSGEMEGRLLLDLVHPEDRTTTAAALERLLITGHSQSFECRGACQDGSCRRLLIDANIQKTTQVIYATAKDITKRKTAEDALQLSEARFRSTFENTLLGMAICDREGHFLEVNQSLCRITGFSEQELLRMDILAITHPDDTRESRGIMHKLIEGATSGNTISRRYLRKNGDTVWSDTRVALERNSQGSPLHFIATVEDLTQRKQAEEDARRSEGWLAFALSSSGIGLYYQDSKITKVCDSQFRLYGLEPAETWISHQRWLELIHPEDRERVVTQQRLASEQGRTYQIQFRVLWPDDSIHWLMCSGRISQDDGRHRKTEVTIDLTDNKRNEMALNEFFAINCSPMAILGFDGSVKMANAALLRMSGFTAEEFGARPAIEFFHPDDRPMMQAQFQKLIAEGGNAAFECRGLCKDGSLRSLLFLATASTEYRSIFTVAHDITNRKLAEKALQESRQCFRSIVETIQEVFWIMDVDVRKTVYVSPASERIWGRSVEELYADPRAFVDAVHPDDREEVLAVFKLQQKGVQYEHEYRVIQPDGSIVWIWNRAFPIRDESGEVVLYTGVAKDITQRKELEQGLRIHDEKLARSNEELERFAYVASHDLQEPLRMVASFTHLLSERYSGRLDETADRYINFAVDGAKRMQQSIADLLSYSRVNSKELNLSSVDCEAAVQEAVRSLRAAIEGSNASIDWDPLPVLSVDQRQFTQLFQNLLGNGIKFTKKQQAPRIHISAEDSGAEWLFSVQDNGIGIEPQHAERVFQVFQRLHTKEEFPGTGIGLAVCKTVVERHGGRIWMESEPGVGSTFRFTVPKKIQGS